MSDKVLFDTIRSILVARTGKGLTTQEVQAINRALGRELAVASAKGSRRTSKAGIDLIHHYESYRATTYPDPGPTGKPVTGGWGSTLDENGKPFVLGVTRSREYWDRLFLRDLAAKETAVNFLIGDAPTTQNQFDALVSFAYNVGEDIDDDDIAEGLGDSTLLKKHLAGDYKGAEAEFGKWIRAKGKVLNGLVRRRKDEAILYGTPDA